MKWGRKKNSPPSPPHSLQITRVFPVSWFSKFKTKGATSETTSDKKQQRGKLDFPTPKDSSFSAAWREAIFYSVVDDDDDAYSSLPFGGEGKDKTRKKKKERINLLWYDSADEFQVSVSGFKRSVHRSITDVVLDIEKLKEKHLRENILRKKKPNQKARDVNSGQDSENKKAREVKVKSAYTGRRRSHSRKTKQIRMKAYGPNADCRIQVLENMKKGRNELNKGTKEQATKFNSFAAVKNSYNPEEDFRDSMVEMIKYKGIKRPQELEQLLSCYLTLNPDNYHHLIIKAFQQVWFELNREEFVDLEI